MTPSAAFEYASDELEAMARARNYYRWILAAWRPYLGATVLEFGAGIGTFSSHLLRERIDHLVVVEPDQTFSDRLAHRFRDDGRVKVVRGTLESAGDTVGSGSMDSIVAVNVLEHIEDEVPTLRAAGEVLKDDGTLLLFVPAFRFLYGSMDRTFGHVRRYTGPELCGTLERLGYRVLESRYMNLLGTLSWLVAGRVLRQPTLSPGAVALADRTLIPIASRLERWFRPPFGQSLMVVARKPQVLRGLNLGASGKSL